MNSGCVARRLVFNEHELHEFDEWPLRDNANGVAVLLEWRPMSFGLFVVLLPGGQWVCDKSRAQNKHHG